MTYLQGECSYLQTTRDARRRRRFNLGRVLVLNTPPAMATAHTIKQYPVLFILASSFMAKLYGRKLKLKATFERGSSYSSFKG